MKFGLVANIIGYVAGAAIALGAYLYWQNLLGQIEKLELENAAVALERDEAVRVARANEASINLMKAAQAWEDQVMADYVGKLESRKPVVREIYRDLTRVDPKDDGPIAPIVLRTLDRLRSAQEAAGHNRN